MDSRLLDDLEMGDFKASRPHPIGRPPKLTSELIEQFCDLLIEGRTIERAAKLSGLSGTTIYRWLAMGKKQDAESIYKELVERVSEATEASEFSLLQSMRKAGSDPKNWRANAWLLERRFPEKYGKRDKNQAMEAETVPGNGDTNHLAIVS